MLSLNDITLHSLVTHYVGNNAAGDVLQLSKTPVAIDSEELKQVLLQYFLTPFKEAASYKLWHPADLKLNEVYHFVSAIFEDPENLLRESANLARHLHDITNLPQIKSGELHVAYFTGIPLNGRMTEAVGIYKTESKSKYLRLEEEKNGYHFSPEEGINPEKMDKGCLTFNVSKDEGYVLHVIDRTAKGGEAQFWKYTFLKIWALDDEYHATENYMRMSKEFIVDQMPTEYEVERVQQIEMLNKSAGYFKKNEQFEKKSFEQEVFSDPELIKSFRKYEKDYADERELHFDKEFDISDAAVKKNARILKSVLKLDKNFHVYVHGNRELIERGFDEKTGLNYYKIYFEEEN
ncbi:MAG: nucleoid-associated protein [Chitinophagaceae bacterium]